MKLYLVSDESDLVNYWKVALHVLKPLTYSSLHEIASQDKAVAFVSDTALLNLPLGTIAHYPQLRIIVLSRVPDFEQAHHFIQEGAMGYGNVMMHESHLHSAFQALEEGKVWLYPDFITQLISQLHEINVHKEIALHRLDILTPREREVALLLNEGKSHLEISDQLHITIRTIKAHSAAIYEKLEVKDRLALSLLLHS